jgi:hypothetical protein
MAEKRVGSVDLETGEILPHVLVAMQRKVPNGFCSGVDCYGTGRNG